MLKNCLKNAIGRVESPWRPASAEESFEIVRRHLFQPIDPDSYVTRDKDAGQIADEVIQRLTGLVSAEVQVTMDIQVHVPDGIPDHVVRTITENCRVLKFRNHGFEAD